MASESRRRASKHLTRRERRTSGGARAYTVPAAPMPSVRRSYMAEPTPIDYSTEYRHIRKDLFRILLWSAILIGGMIVLAFLPIF